MPPRVQELALRRLARNSRPAVAAITVASVIARAGRDFDRAEVALDEPPDAVLAAVEEAISGGSVPPDVSSARHVSIADTPAASRMATQTARHTMYVQKLMRSWRFMTG